MSRRPEQENSPLTFDLNDDLLAKLGDVCARQGVATKSEVIRHAISVFDFAAFQPDIRSHRQISVRLAPKQKAALIKYARLKGVSIGELLRVALEALPANLAGLGTKTKNEKAEAMPKKAKKKAAPRKKAKKK
jgi:replication initiation and membrane attachment protein DnaB